MRTPKPIAFHQLCALVKTVLLQEPGMLDAEWKARVRETMVQWGFEDPSSDTLNHAMTRVDHAVRRTIGQRPVPGVSPSSARPPDPPVSTARTHHPAGWDLVLSLAAQLQRMKDAICAALKAGPLSPADLSARLDQPAARLNYHIRSLEEDGLVVRTGDTTNRRIALAGSRPAKEGP